MRKIVLVSLDAMFDRDWSHYDGRWMGEWLKKAAVCKRVKTVFPALTYPAHTTLITGCDPIQHGIGQNQPFQPGQNPAMRVWHWMQADVARPTLFSAVAERGGKCASILWPITGKSKVIRWNFPEVVALPGENQALKMLSYGTLWWIAHMEWKHGRKRKSIREPYLSDYAVTLACDVIRQHQPDLTAVHLVDVDEMRHRHGVNSPEARQGMDRMEKRVRDIWETMQDTPGMEDALLVLVSDHGQADVSKDVELGSVLREAGFAVQVQSNGMSAYMRLENKQDEEPIRRWLEKNGPAAGISHVYTNEERAAMGCIAWPDLVVEAAEDVVFSDALPQAKREKATHGFGPGHPAENCLLAIRGRDTHPCEAEGMLMRDVAPTLARVMGVEMSFAVGTACEKLVDNA